MKVAIITIHRIFNYGSVLQAYATQKVIEDLGYDVKIIDYKPDRISTKKILLKILEIRNDPLLLKILYFLASTLLTFLDVFYFGSFVKKYLNTTKIKYKNFQELQENIPDADIYLTGSDQVWNFDHNKGIDKCYFLDFLDDGKIKIAYSSSFGRVKLHDYEKKETAKLLKKYYALGVRDTSAVNIIKELGRNDAVLVLDPVMLLNNVQWGKIASPIFIKKPYLLVYGYADVKRLLKISREIADRKNLPMVKIGWEFSKPIKVEKSIRFISPEKFVGLIKNADYLVTNSFHGMVFGLIFNKQMNIVLRDEQDSRLIDLAERLGIKEKVIANNVVDSAIDISINYNNINLLIETERRKSIDFLTNALRSSKQFKE